MLSHIKAVTDLGIDIESPLRAVQDVRRICEESARGVLSTALSIIKAVGGIDKQCTSAVDALHIAQQLVKDALTDSVFNPEQSVVVAEARNVKLRATMPFLYAEERTTETGETKTIADVQVVVKADGKIKKGGKQVVAYQLFLKYAVGEKCSNQELIAHIMQETSMSKAGATTYCYNARKQYETETGAPFSFTKK